MDHVLAVDIHQPPSDVHQLKLYSVINKYEAKDGDRTSSNRSASGFSLRKPFMFPFDIQSDIIAK